MTQNDATQPRKRCIILKQTIDRKSKTWRHASPNNTGTTLETFIDPVSTSLLIHGVHAMTKTTLLAIVIAVLFIGGCVLIARLKGDQIDSPQAKDLVKKGALLVDVRTPEEFAEGHIDKAVNIPVAQLASRISELGAKDTTIVLYCRSGMRSSRAASTLQEKGFTKVYDLGPMSKW